MESDLRKRQVSFEQLSALLEFLKEHNELARGLTRGRRGKLHTLKIWNMCAKKLNVFKDGATKDGKGWSKDQPISKDTDVIVFLKDPIFAQLGILNQDGGPRLLGQEGDKIKCLIRDLSLPALITYWCDWKYRVRRRALELRAAKDSNRPAPDGVTQLSAMEETILGIIGDSALDGIVIKNDPLGDGATEEEDSYHIEEETPNQYCETRLRSRRGRKRRHSPKDTSDMDERSASPVDRKPRVGIQKNGHIDDVEADNEATEFLRLEKEKLENSKRLTDSIQTIASEITRLTDVMSHIRDVLINNRINI